MSTESSQPSQDPTTSPRAESPNEQNSVSTAASESTTGQAAPAAADASPSDPSDRPKIQVGRTGATPPAPSAPVPQTAAPPAAPLRKDRRRREEKEQKSRAEPLVHVPTVRVPSRREPLSADLEAEMNQAFGEVSLDRLIDTGQGGAVGRELELESRVSATVVRLHGDNVFFSLGGNHEGIVSVRIFKAPPDVGTTMDVVIRGYNADDGLYEVSVPGASIDVSDWSDLSDGALVEARITAANLGGLECMVNNIRGFIPASQISLYRVENLSEFIGQKLQCLVTEANPMRRNLVLSHRAILEREQEEARRKLLEEIDVGQVREGVVRSIRDFGAFVDLGGLDGLIHISQLSWDRVQHPSEVLQEGQKVRVKVEKVDKQTGKIGLSYRDLLEHPWTNIEQRFPVGTVVKGMITRLAKFGAFVKLAPGIEGLVHLSEISHQPVRYLAAYLQEGKEVEVKVMTVDQEAQRIGLSMKALTKAPEKAEPEKPEEEEAPRKLAVPKRNDPLKGGTDRPTGGDKFGLKW